jgi:hypothetical protein
MLKFLRDPAWQGVSGIAGILVLIVTIVGWEKTLEILRAPAFIAVAVFLLLIIVLGFALQRKRFKEIFASAVLMLRRRLHLILSVLAFVWLVAWIQSNLLIQPLHPLADWTPWQYVSLLVPLGLLVYILIIEPWRRTRRAERSRDFVANLWAETTKRVPATPIVFYDSTFPCSWVYWPEQAASYFTERGFLPADAQELEGMMERVVERGTAHKTLFVFIHDIVPRSITEVCHPSCTLRRYLDAGGRVVWWGDIPLYYQGLPGHKKEIWREGKCSQEILSVDHHHPSIWNKKCSARDIRLTDAGRAIGMTIPNREGVRFAAVGRGDPNTIVYSEFVDLGSEAKRCAISWRKVFNSDYPHSGFMQYPLGGVDCREKSVVEDFFRFSVSDWPLAFTT